MLTINGLSKKYGKNTVLDDINISFSYGKIYGLVGRNGSGKTMLLKSILGFTIPDEGTVTIDGKVIGKDIDIPESIGVMMENPQILLLDEPMNGLDDSGVDDMRRILLEYINPERVIEDGRIKEYGT